MQGWDEPATAPDVVLYLRDEVTPLVRRMVAKRAVGYRELLTEQDREDLVSTVLAKYHQKWGRDARPEYLGAWLKPVVQAAIIDELRRRGARPKLADLPDGDDDRVPFEEMLVSLRTPSSIAHCAKLLQDALHDLSADYPDDATLIHLRYMHDLQVGEIAVRLGVSEETAKKRVQRATARLREAVTRLTDGAGV